ncbi:MAG: hypothetical protein HYX53_06745 [Chloroflexi bacterium]|nr:hypothetical protein [Chloroflexota bacterium]
MDHNTEDTLAIESLEPEFAGAVRQVHDSGWPLALTEGGQTTAVVISPEDFESLRARGAFAAFGYPIETEEEFEAGMREAEEDSKAGRVYGHDQVMAWIRSLGTDHELPAPGSE